MTPSTSGPLLGTSGGSSRTPSALTGRTPGTTRTLRSSTLKRDSSTANLDKEPHPTNSKRALLSSTLTAASTERQLASLQTTNHSLTSKLRETEHELASVQRDRRFLADREKAEREAREESEKKWEEERKKHMGELKALREALAKSDENLERVRTEARKMRDELGRARAEVDRKDLEIGRVKKEADDVKDELRSTKGRLRDVEKEKEELEDRVGKESEEVVERIAREIEERYTKEMEDERTAMEETLEEALKEKDAEIDDLRATVNEQQKEWTKMEDYAETLEKKLADANSRLADNEKLKNEALAVAAKAIGKQASESEMDVDSAPSSSQPVPTQPMPSTPSRPSGTETLSSMSLASPSSASRFAREAISSRLATPRRSSISTYNNSPLRRQSSLFSPGTSNLSTPLKISLIKKDPDAEALGPHLASLTNHLRKVESENVKLRAELGVLRGKDESIQVLKEENTSLQSRIKRQEKEIEKLVKASTMSSPSLPSSSSRPTSSPTSPRSVQETNELAKLRLEHANLLEKFGEVKAELTGLKNAAQTPGPSAPKAPEPSESKVEEPTDDEAQITQRRLRLREREIEALKKELEFAKGMMDSYATELQLTTPNAGLGSSSTPLNELNSQRVIQLEALLEQAKTENTKLRDEVETLLAEKKGTVPVDSINADLSRINELQTKVTALESTITEHLATIDNLEQELFELRGEIAGGRHVPPNVRILKSTEGAPGDHLAASTSTSQVGSESDDLVPKETLMSALREGKRLQEELERREKRLQRLKEIFNSKSVEFREAVGALLGIKLAFYPNGQVRITSLYDMTATFVFSPNKDDLKMQLIGVGTDDGPPQDWRENLPNWTSYWIEQEQCIPGFLATVTLEVYDKWKSQQGGHG
ncbi:coiled-coil domain-containing protein mad1 [Marasmius crinis-equi]|uniref:Spindle assembly checkpoint component MAD1 n=1 Tax=Marasmius crinis-equi TaxID=585013 RepID=A0ABR3F2V5_9AGAR